MADVYLANDTILNRTIAIKIIRTSLAKIQFILQDFKKLQQQLRFHIKILLKFMMLVKIISIHIVMEYVPGRTLKELIAKECLHVMEAIDIMKQVLSGTARAHQMGIIHRDLKPQNILVTDTGTAKIADFGIASIQSLTQFTQTDVIMGSLHYLAPELARGEKATVQSDIYALGIVFYELLRGQVPFNGESPVNIALKHMQEELPSLREFNPSIPQSVENIVIKATAKNLNDRYKNASEMLEDLQTCLSRGDEEKLVFNHDGESDPTIVVNPRQIFDNNEEEPKKLKKELLKRRIIMVKENKF
ncbi:MAG: protein kinase domain-containing protein [Faecalibacillus faecis]